MLETHDLSKPEVLQALYNAAKVSGMGFLDAKPGDLPEELADKCIAHSTYFDVLFGRIMRVDLSDLTTIDPMLYDRDNGSGAAQRALDDFCLAKWESQEK